MPIDSTLRPVRQTCCIGVGFVAASHAPVETKIMSDPFKRCCAFVKLLADIRNATVKCGVRCCRSKHETLDSKVRSTERTCKGLGIQRGMTRTQGVGYKAAMRQVLVRACTAMHQATKMDTPLMPDQASVVLQHCAVQQGRLFPASYIVDRTWRVFRSDRIQQHASATRIESNGGVVYPSFRRSL
eukprot:1519432-Rhodomonas_salina.1